MPKENIELELKLPLLNLPAFVARATDLMGQGSERFFESTVMYDNVREFKKGSNLTFQVTSNTDTQTSLQWGTEKIDVIDMTSFVKILELIGFAVNIETDQVTLHIIEHRPISYVNTVQDARLRLRSRSSTNSSETILSYKRPLVREGIKQEIEYETPIIQYSSIDKILQRIGFEPVTSYERYRTTWEYNHKDGLVHVDVDEFPFGNFVEIEGPTTKSIQKVASMLLLDTKQHLGEPYDTIYTQSMLSRGEKPELHIRFMR